MLGPYFYNQTIRKTIAVFGSLFNNITIRRKTASGGFINKIKVPLSYGPREKFLARLDSLAKQEDQIAIKLPRISFEIAGIAYDSVSKLNKMNKRMFTISGDTSRRNTIYQSVPYIISISMSIYGKNQDDALQVFEQILPTFTPEYTVTIKDFEGPNTKSDVPIILKNTELNNEYTGDLTSRQFIEYTLSFDVKVRFAGATTKQGIIRDIDIDFIDLDAYPKSDSQFFEELGVELVGDSDSQYLGIDQSDDDTFTKLSTMKNT